MSATVPRFRCNGSGGSADRTGFCVPAVVRSGEPRDAAPCCNRRVTAPDSRRTPGFALLALMFLVLAAAPSGARASGAAADHAAQDAVTATPAQERAMERNTNAATAADASAAQASTPADEPHRFGRWSAPVPWPVLGVHTAVMPDGRVLAYDSVGDEPVESYPEAEHTTTRATMWNPGTGTHERVDVDTGFNIFCSGLAHLMDGRLFLSGGNKDEFLSGIEENHLFDGEGSDWSVEDERMMSGRWYPTVTPMTNGEMLITSGREDTPEVRRLDGTLRRLPAATRSIALYPWMDVAPDGRAFKSGPEPGLSSLDTAGSGTWEDHGPRDTVDRDYGSHAVFGVGRTLVSGGGASTKSARVIDLNGASPQVSVTAPMAFGRRQHNLTVLADGSVLATGGLHSGANLVDLQAGVYNAERWDPATGTWTTLAAAEATRQYHSTALLLPDARVLTSGGGICDVCARVGYLEKNAEVFSPPYLFKPDGTAADRPVITGAPAATGHGQGLVVQTPDAAAIAKVSLVRLGAVTHSVDMGQRYVPLSFTTQAGQVTAQISANEHVTPPGVYMLFLTNTSGVPSVSRMVRVGPDAPTVSVSAPARATAPANVTLTASAADPDGGVTKVEFFRGATKVAEDTSAPYGTQLSNLAAGTYVLKARATDVTGLRTTSASTTVVVDPAAPTVSLTQPAAGTRGTAPLNVALAADATDADSAIARVEFLAGATKIGEDTTSPYAATWSAAPAGTHAITAKAIDATGLTTTSAARTVVVDPALPQVALTSAEIRPPAAAPAVVDLAATASDADDAVARVEWLAGATVVASDTSEPYAATWTGAPAGTHTITARATDAAGHTTTDATGTTITVRAAPVVALTAPAAGTRRTAPGSFGLTASASDADNTITRVEFFAGATSLGVVTTPPYQLQWTQAAAGSYALTARATDATGLTTTSAARSVVVDPAPPVVTVTEATVRPPGTARATVDLAATASSLGGDITRVEFFAGATRLGEDTAAPYALAWEQVPAGDPHDHGPGDEHDGPEHHEPRPQRHRRPRPAPGLDHPGRDARPGHDPATVDLAALASDADGTIARVEFKVGATSVGVVASAPFALAWERVPAGTHAVTATATDDTGLATTGAPVTVVVAAAPDPAVVAPAPDPAPDAPAVPPAPDVQPPGPPAPGPAARPGSAGCRSRAARARPGGCG